METDYQREFQCNNNKKSTWSRYSFSCEGHTIKYNTLPRSKLDKGRLASTALAVCWLDTQVQCQLFHYPWLSQPDPPSMQGHGYVMTMHTLLAIHQHVQEFTDLTNFSIYLDNLTLHGYPVLTLDMIPWSTTIYNDWNAVHTSYSTSMRLPVQDKYLYDPTRDHLLLTMATDPSHIFNPTLYVRSP